MVRWHESQNMRPLAMISLGIFPQLVEALAETPLPSKMDSVHHAVVGTSSPREMNRNLPSTPRPASSMRADTRRSRRFLVPSPALRFTFVLPCRAAHLSPSPERPDTLRDGRTLRAHLEFLLTLAGNNLTSIGPQFSKPASPRRSSEATSSRRPSRVSERRPSSS